MVNDSNSDQRSDATGVGLTRRSPFLLPLILAAAFLNVGGGSGGGGGPKCQGVAATHVFGLGTNVATAGDDVIVLTVGTSTGSATVAAAYGDDLICVISHADNEDIRIYGGPGTDTVYGGAAGERLYGEGGSDILYGGDGDDIIEGGDGIDFLWGDGGDDALFGQADVDSLSGGSGEDWLFGGADGDILHGSTGNDHLYGGGGDDFLSGNDGDDDLFGNDGNDQLRGGTGADELVGHAGNDTLWSGDEQGTLEGGPGTDTAYMCGPSTFLVDNMEAVSWDDPDCSIEEQEPFSVHLKISICDLPEAEKAWPIYLSLTGTEEIAVRRSIPELKSGAWGSL